MDRKRVLAIFVVFAMVAIVPLSAFAGSRYNSEPSEVDVLTQENVDEVGLYADEIPEFGDGNDLLIEPETGYTVEYSESFPGTSLIKIDENEVVVQNEVISAREFQESSHLNTHEPTGGYSVPSILTPSINSDWDSKNARSIYNIDSQISLATATASLTIMSKSATSVTFNVVYPTSGAKGNVIVLWDFNQGQSLFPMTDYANYYNRVNGTYTISGLVPGGMYQVGIMWSTNGGTNYGGANTIFRRAHLPYNTPESLERSDGTHVYSRIESADKSLALFTNFNIWLSRMDSVYSALETLTGEVPYEGLKIGLVSTREDLNTYSVDGQNYWFLTWSYAGNPAAIAEYYYKSLMKRLGDGDWGEAPIHELSHDFDKPAWEFDSEVLADFKEYYVVESLNAKVYRPDTNKYYTGAGFYNFFKTDQMESYDNTFAKGYYHSRGMTAIMIRIKNAIGWQRFMDTFRYFNNLADEQLSNNNIGRFNIFMSKLKDVSGTDVLGMLTSSEKQIIGNRLGGVVNYMVLPTADDYGNTFATASSIPVSTSINGTINTIGDVDYFKFTVPTSGKYTISTAGSTDTVGDLYNSNYAWLDGNDDLDGINFSFSPTLAANQTYYLKVKAYSTYTGPYVLRVSPHFERFINYYKTLLMHSTDVGYVTFDVSANYREVGAIAPLNNTTTWLFRHANVSAISSRPRGETPACNLVVYVHHYNSSNTRIHSFSMTNVFDSILTSGREYMSWHRDNDVRKTYNKTVGNYGLLEFYLVGEYNNVANGTCRIEFNV